MSKTNNPFGDIEAMFQQMQVPGMDMDSMLDAFKKNLAAMNEAGRAASDGMRAMTERQVDIIREAKDEMRAAAETLSSGADAANLQQRLVEIHKSAQEKATANMKELAEMMNKANTESQGILKGRMDQGMAELKSIMESTNKS